MWAHQISVLSVPHFHDSEANKSQSKYISLYVGFRYTVVSILLQDFEILSKGFSQRKFKRKISETLFIKENKPSLNRQEMSVPLKLFNSCKI